MANSNWSGKNRFRSYHGTRVRFQRLSDCRLFSGWIQELDEERCVVRTSPDVAVMEGDEFRFEVKGQDTMLHYYGVLQGGSHLDIMRSVVNQAARELRHQILAAGDLEFDFAISSEVTIQHSTEEPRFATQGARGIVVHDEQEHDLTLLDASENGLGISTRTSFKRGDLVTVKVGTHVGEVAMQAEVKYCKPEAHTPGAFRVGLKIKDLDRLAKARWKQIRA